MCNVQVMSSYAGILFVVILLIIKVYQFLQLEQESDKMGMDT